VPNEVTATSLLNYIAALPTTTFEASEVGVSNSLVFSVDYDASSIAIPTTPPSFTFGSDNKVPSYPTLRRLVDATTPTSTPPCVDDEATPLVFTGESNSFPNETPDPTTIGNADIYITSNLTPPSGNGEAMAGHVTPPVFSFELACVAHENPFCPTTDGPAVGSVIAPNAAVLPNVASAIESNRPFALQTPQTLDTDKGTLSSAAFFAATPTSTATVGCDVAGAAIPASIRTSRAATLGDFDTTTACASPDGEPQATDLLRTTLFFILDRKDLSRGALATGSAQQ
jgi:hypothetical protein